MPGQEILDLLLSSRDTIAQTGVRRLVLFGPAARGELRPGGEVQLLVELAPPQTLEHFLSVRDALVNLLGSPVELVVEDPTHPEIWPYIRDDARPVL